MNDSGANSTADTANRAHLPGVIAAAVLAGLVVGVLDLWIAPTVRMFLAGVAAGVSFCLPVFILLYLMARSGPVFKTVVWLAGGAVGGVVWWLVARPESRGPGLAVLVGLGLAVISILGDRGFPRGRSKAL